MRFNVTFVLSIFALCCSACAGDVVKVQYNGTKATVSDVKPADSVKVKTDGASVLIEDLATSRELKVQISGTSDDGQFILKSKTKAKIELDNLKLQSNEGAPITLKTKKKTEIIVPKGTVNSLTVTACKDTANNKAAVIYSKDKLAFSGEGKLDLLATGDGCKGISAKNNITFKELTLNVKTTGDNLGPDTTRNMGFGGFGGFGGPGGPGGFDGPPMNFNFDELPDSVKQQMEEMRKRFENGEFPPFGGHGGPGGHGGRPEGMPGGRHDGMQGPPQGGFGGFGGFGGGFGGFGEQGGHQGPPEGEGAGGFMGKQKFMGTCKGIKSTGVITINSGNITVYTTSRAAEGIEGKEGVIINGGEVSVNAMDDAINSNGPIAFNGGKTTAISRGNDSVDSNKNGMFGPGGGGFGFGGPFGGGDKKDDKKEGTDVEPSIKISGGEVYAYSQTGPPEEGLDCDFAPIGITGGYTFSIGAGMGEMPSTPTNQSAKQPTALIIGLDIFKDKQITVKNEKGKVIFKTVGPFNFQRSASILSCPDFKKGGTYTIESGTYSKTFKLEENFTIVR